MQSRCLILIDLQQGFLDINHWGSLRNNPQAESNAQKLLIFWRSNLWPVIHVAHDSQEASSPLAPGNPGNDFLEDFTPIGDELVFRKTVNSAFIGTNLEETLRQNNWNELVIAGLTTNHCISTSVRMAGNLGFDVWLAEDATATFDRTAPDGTVFPAQLMHDTAIASLHNEFATIKNTNEILKL